MNDKAIPSDTVQKLATDPQIQAKKQVSFQNRTAPFPSNPTFPYVFIHSFPAKQPHPGTLSVRYVEGYGERPPDIGHRRTVFVKKRPLRPLQGRCPCGSLAKTLSSGSGLTRFAMQLPDCPTDVKWSLSPKGRRPKPNSLTVSL